MEAYKRKLELVVVVICKRMLGSEVVEICKHKSEAATCIRKPELVVAEICKCMLALEAVETSSGKRELEVAESCNSKADDGKELVYGIPHKAS